MRKIDFQEGSHGGHPGFPIKKDLAIFDLLVTPMLPIKFQDNWPSVSGKEAKNRFLKWRPSWISDRNSFSYFHLQVAPMLPTKFQVNWLFLSGEEVKNRFSKWRTSWISDRNYFSYFCMEIHCGHRGFSIRTFLAILFSTSHSGASYQVSRQLAFRLRR